MNCATRAAVDLAVGSHAGYASKAAAAISWSASTKSSWFDAPRSRPLGSPSKEFPAVRIWPFVDRSSDRKR